MGAASSTSGTPAFKEPVQFGTLSTGTFHEAVASIPHDRQIVLLGESTHGTEEFYRSRAAITKHLIEERGFKAVVFEADWPTMLRVNEFTHRRETAPFPDEWKHFPSWMWQNQCMAEFFDWCKKQLPEKKAELFGMDCYSLFESKRQVIAFLKQHDPEFCKEVEKRLAYMDRYTDTWKYADALINGTLSKISGHIDDTLTSIQSRLQWGSDKYDCTPSERLSAEQNCEVLISATEYYKKQVSEPAGSQASWNTRDQHMTTTLLRIRAHLGEDTKIVVWAHNSHVGDSTATGQGGVNFERNETWNLGQMVRGTFGLEKTWIVGQYTYGGSVTAASRWGGEHSAMKLKDAIKDSYEDHLHAIERETGKPFTFVTAPFLGQPEGVLRQMLDEKHVVAGALFDMCSAARKQRWVGVQYKPETEMRSHYGEMMLSLCYDQVVFIDKTTALAPVLQKAKGGGGGGMSGLTVASSKRLLKEYQRLLRKPPPGIEAHPLESNILEWHFLIKPDQPPYVGGEYHGSLEFPMEYPMKPPAFRVFTPSGRFEPGVRLCMSMSDYHPESWNPSWCRFCFSSEGELISPCMCKGSNEWLHLECLREWQRRVVIDQPTHPKYQTSIDRICNVCLEPFTGLGEAPDRHEQIKNYTGAELSGMAARPGNLLVSTRESSRESLEIIEQHPEIRDRLITWTKAVFLMIRNFEGRGGDGGLLAVSMSQPVARPPADAGLSRGERREWEGRGGGGVRVRHYDGGPMQRDEPICVVNVHDPGGVARRGAVTALEPCWVYGGWEGCHAAAMEQARAGGGGVTVNVVWGCGGWGGTQILAEIARGGWGIATVEDYVDIRPDASLEMDWLLDFSWERIVPLAQVAPRTEYTKGKN